MNKTLSELEVELERQNALLDEMRGMAQSLGDAELSIPESALAELDDLTTSPNPYNATLLIGVRA